MSIPYHLIGGNWHWDRPRSSQLIGFSCWDRRVEWSVNLFFPDMLNSDTSHFPQTWRLLFGDSFDVRKAKQKSWFNTVPVSSDHMMILSHALASMDRARLDSPNCHQLLGLRRTLFLSMQTHACFNRTVWANLLRSANDKAFFKIQTHRIYVW